jgi:PAS domain S-box-containing protein
MIPSGPSKLELAADLLEAAPVILLWLDDDGRIARVNPFFEQVTGWRLDEVRGRDWVSTFLPEREQQCIRSVFRATLDGAHTSGTVNHIVTRAGAERAIEWHNRRLHDDEGRPRGILSVGVDVTDRLRAEANLRARERELRQSRMQLAEAQRLARIGSWELDLATNEATWSEEMYRILEVDPSRKTGLLETLLSRVHPEDQQRTAGYFEHALGARHPLEDTARLAMPDGHIKHVRLRATRMGGETEAPGTGTTIVGTIEDVTDRKLADIALLESEQHFEGLVAASPVGVFKIDSRGGVTFVNRRWCEITGLDPEDANRWVTALHPDDRATVNAEWLRVASERSAFRLEYRLVRPDGVETWVLGQAVPLRGPSGALRGYIGTITDVTEARRAQEAARLNAARLNEAQRIAKIGSWELDLVTNALTWSDEVFRIFEIDPERFGASYEAFLAAVHPEDRELVDATYKRSLETREPYAVVHRLLMPDGRVKHVHERGQSFYDERGNAVRSIGTVQDISSQIWGEQRLRRILDGMFTFVGLYDLEGTRIETNRAPLDMAGLRREDVIGKPFWETYWWSYSEEAQDQIRSALARAARGEVVRDDFRVRVGEDRFIVIDAMFGPLLDESGRVESIVGSGVDVTDRIRAEEVLRTHSQVLMSMGEGVNFADANGVIRFANPALDTMFGYERGELVGKHVSILNDATEEESARIVEAIMAALRARSKWEGEFRNRRKDGSVFYTHAHITPLEGRGEALWVCIQQDVTERRLAEEKRSAADRRYRLLVENAPYCIHEIDRDGRILSMNAAGLRMLGLASEDDVRGRPYLGAVAEADRPRVAELFQDALDGASSEFEFDSTSGQRFRSTFVPLLDGQGRVERLMGVTVDETERVRAMQSTRRTSDLLRRVIDSSPDWISVKDIDHRFVLVNKAFASAQGLEHDQMIGRPATDFFSRELSEGNQTKGVRGIHDDDHEALAGRIVHNPNEPRTMAGGELRLFDTFRVPLRDEHDRVYGVLSYARDVTDQRATAEAQKRSLEEKDVLLREIHHRVKNNMQIVSSMLNLQSAAIDDPPARTALAEARERIQSIALVHELLYRSKSFAALDIGAHLRAIADMLLGPHEPALGVVRNFDDDPVLVDIDTAVPLGLIMNELLSNALKHAVSDRQQAHVGVAFRRKDGGIEFVVTDDGCGLPEGFRIDAVRSLGLRIVTALVGQVGGRLSLRSGPGTTATVWVPIAQAHR